MFLYSITQILQGVKEGNLMSTKMYTFKKILLVNFKDLAYSEYFESLPTTYQKQLRHLCGRQFQILTQ
jgi:hypothetical protein